MEIKVEKLSLAVGYRDDWQGKVASPTPERQRLLKQSARARMRKAYGWLNGPILDPPAYLAVVEDLERAFNTGDGRLDEQELKAAAERLIRAKQPADVSGSFQVVVDPGDAYGECYPNPDPPPFVWRDGHALNLIAPDGKRASVLAEADGVQQKVKLIVVIRWEIPEI